MHHLGSGRIAPPIPAVVFSGTLGSHVRNAPLPGGVRTEVVRRQTVSGCDVLHLVSDRSCGQHYPMTVLRAEAELLLVALGPRVHHKLDQVAKEVALRR